MAAAAEFRADAGFLLDPLSSIWLLFVTGVGMLIHIYSMGYMAHEGGYYRFFGYLNLFMFSMLTLILANNYAVMFVGWEGVGLCSYLLIGFYFLRHSASTAANKAFIVNRIGDAGFLLGMFTIAWYFGSVQYTAVNHLARSGQFPIGDPVITTACLLLFVGRLRQVGAVSAVCLAARCDGRPDAGLRADPRGDHGHRRRLHGGALQRAVRAGAECDEDGRHHRRADRDLRRDHRPGAERHQARAGVLDGFAAGIHVPGARRGRIRRRRLPRLHACVLQGAALPRRRLGDPRHERRAGDAAHGRAARQNQDHLRHHADCDLAISGIPGFAGFFSKDAILWETWSREGGAYRYLWYIAFLTALMTSFYMFRLIYLTFFGKPRMSHEVEHHIHESPKSMTVPLVILAICSVGAGFLGLPHSLGGSNRFEKFLEPVFAKEAVVLEEGGKAAQVAAGEQQVEHTDPMEYTLMFASVGAAIVGWWLAQRAYKNADKGYKEPIEEISPRWYKTLFRKWYVDEIYDWVFTGRKKVGPVRLGAMGLGEAAWKFDANVIDGAVNGAGWTTRMSGTLSVLWDKWIIDGLLVNGVGDCDPAGFLSRAPGAVGPGAVVRAGDGRRTGVFRFVLRHQVVTPGRAAL